MSKGKAALKRLFGSYVSSKCYGINYKQDDEDYNIIEKDLDKLEALEKEYNNLKKDYDAKDLECIDLLKENQELKEDSFQMQGWYDCYFKENERLIQENQELKEENDRLAKECEEWADIVVQNDKAHLFFVNNQAKLIEKYMQAFDIFKDKNIRIFTRNCCIDNKEVITYHLASDYNTYNLTQEQYKLLDEINKINAGLVKKCRREL